MKFLHVVTHDYEKEDGMIKTKCSGRCECYEEEFGDEEFLDERRASSLIFSYRLTSVVAVSVFGLAVSKFVNDHIDDCHALLRKQLGRGTGTKKKIKNKRRRTCSVEDAECKEKEDEYDDFGNKIIRDQDKRAWWECHGHCIPSHNEHKGAKKITGTYKCKSKWAESEMVDAVGEAGAKMEYHTYHLNPYCNSFTDLYTSISGKMQGKIIFFPCVAGMMMNNIFCYKKSDEIEWSSGDDV